MKHFDFDEWATLHEQDPQAFEVKRGAALDRLIRSVDEESRLALEQTLFKVEMVRRRAKSPLQATIEASNLMWESFGKLREKIQELEAASAQSDLSKGANRLRIITAGESFEVSAEAAEDSAKFVANVTEGRHSEVSGAKVIRFPSRG